MTALILDEVADFNVLDAKGMTVMHMAADTCNVGIAQLLLSKGADINAKSDFGATPLHSALKGERDKGVSQKLLTYVPI